MIKRYTCLPSFDDDLGWYIVAYPDDQGLYMKSNEIISVLKTVYNLASRDEVLEIERWMMSLLEGLGVDY